MPDGAVVGAAVASDGVKLRHARWPATAERARGTICLMQGRCEIIEKYFETVGDLRRRGFAVVTFDWRGQGGSDRLLADRRKGYVGKFSDYVDDLDAIMRQVVLPDCPRPHYALAHSTGGLVCLTAVRSGRVAFDGIVLSSPLLALAEGKGPPQPVACAIAALLVAIGLGTCNVSAGKNTTIVEELPFEGNPLTTDPQRFARGFEIATKLPDLGIGLATFSWLSECCKAMTKAAKPDFAQAIQTPVLLLSGADDGVVSPGAIAAMAARLPAATHVAISGARHELMMELDALREQFWKAFDTFLPAAPRAV